MQRLLSPCLRRKSQQTHRAALGSSALSSEDEDGFYDTNITSILNESHLQTSNCWRQKLEGIKRPIKRFSPVFLRGGGLRVTERYSGHQGLSLWEELGCHALQISLAVAVGNIFSTTVKTDWYRLEIRIHSWSVQLWLWLLQYYHIPRGLQMFCCYIKAKT